MGLDDHCPQDEFSILHKCYKDIDFEYGAEPGMPKEQPFNFSPILIIGAAIVLWMVFKK